jgi:radical SAM protein with 4Fe4S-binding SPASM domain
MKKIKYLYYRFLWHLAPFYSYGRFVHVDIEINNNCNQKCIFCFHSKKKLPFKIESMPTSEVFKNIQQAYWLGAKSLKFNLRGEPLINKNICDYIRFADSLGFTDIMLNTNGVLLDTNKVIDLQRAGLTTCIISVDSLKKDNYCKLHGVNVSHFEQLVNNLFVIQKLLKTKSLNFKVICNFHINEINENEDFEMYKKELFPLEINIRYTQNRDGKHISIDNKTKIRKTYCPHMLRRLTILTDGNIYPCCVCYESPTDIKLDRHNLKRSWTGHKRKTLIDNYRKGIYTESCKNCTSADIYI